MNVIPLYDYILDQCHYKYPNFFSPLDDRESIPSIRKSLDKFPMDKYITYYCGMLHNNELPEDVIRLILFSMISTDEVIFRLLIIGTIMPILKINTDDIKLPTESDLTQQEIYEAMVLKVFHISISKRSKFPDVSWGTRYKLVFNNDVKKKEIYINSYYKCICCNFGSSKLCNNVPICQRCYDKIKAYRMQTKIEQNFKELLTINYNLWTGTASFKGFKKLKLVTRYDSIEFGFPDITSSDECQIKNPIFISKIVCAERRETKRSIKLQLKELEKINNVYYEALKSHMDTARIIYRKNSEFQNMHRIVRPKIILLSATPIKSYESSDFASLLGIPFSCNLLNKNFLTSCHNILQIENKKELIIDTFKKKDKKKYEKYSFQKRLECDAKKYINNKYNKVHRITQPQSKILQKK